MARKRTRETAPKETRPGTKPARAREPSQPAPSTRGPNPPWRTSGLGFLVLGLVIGVGATAVFVARRPVEAAKTAGERHEGRQGLINPLLECWTNRHVHSERTAEDSIRDYLAKLSESSVSLVSVYFRDLDNGPWFGVNETESFQPSSLNKVHMMLELFKAAETDAQLLRRTIMFDGRSFDENLVAPNIKPSRQLRHGESYTVEELIRRMIVHSDNAASKLLVETPFNGKLFDFCADDVPFPCEGALLKRVSVKNYAAAFRVLYNASYLSRPASQRALAILTQTEFRDGIVAGVPAGVTVAHKFGEGNFEGVKQLHDCGIVYFPSSPYLLCVMTRGSDFGALTEVVKQVSRLTYTHVAGVHAATR